MESGAHVTCHVKPVYVATKKGVLRSVAMARVSARVTETYLPEIKKRGGTQTCVFPFLRIPEAMLSLHIYEIWECLRNNE